MLALFALLAVVDAASVRKHRHRLDHKRIRQHAWFNTSLCSFPGATQAPADGSGADGTVDGAAVNTDVLKDGFWYVACKSDAMYSAGDKFGDGKQRFQKGLTAGTSIVRYDVIHDRETQKPMTPQVCFDFCRTVPDMQFFGLTEGRECYCEHYYKPKPGDGVCDLPCEGDSAAVCGGKEMSSLYQMHSCEGGFATKAEDFYMEKSPTSWEANRAYSYANWAADDLQSAGDWLESVGDGSASPLAQAAKAAAGPLAKLSTRMYADCNTWWNMESEFFSVDPYGSDLGATDRKFAENVMRKMGAHADKIDKAMPDDKAAIAAVHPSAGWAMKSAEASDVYYEEGSEAGDAAWAELDDAVLDHALDANNAVATYEHIVPDLGTVCLGELTGVPKVYVTAQECALACDEEAPSSSPDRCVAFQYFEDYDGLCFLFKEVTGLTTYESDKKKKLFLQTEKPKKKAALLAGKQPEILSDKDSSVPWCLVRHTDFGPSTRKVIKAATPVAAGFGEDLKK